MIHLKDMMYINIYVFIWRKCFTNKSNGENGEKDTLANGGNYQRDLKMEGKAWPSHLATKGGHIWPKMKVEVGLRKLYGCQV